MSDCIEIGVADRELEALDDDLRPVFQPGCTCTVQQCGPKVYNSINTYWKHWKTVHVATIPLFKCDKCNFKHPEKAQVTRHIKRVHGVDSDLDISVKMVNNNKYINPGGALCYKFKQPKEQRKMAAAAKRKFEAEKLYQTPHF